MICGDDIVLRVAIHLLELAKQNVDTDLVVLDDGQALYPGVLLAV